MTVEIHRMSNGVRVVTEHMPGLASASLGVWVAAGGRHERLEQNGIAHFLEHMMFKGSPKVGVGDFSRLVALAAVLAPIAAEPAPAPAPEPAPEKAEPVIGPAIQPVVLGDGAEVARPKRQGWWKRPG